MKLPKLRQPNWLALGAVIAALLISTGIVLWGMPALSGVPWVTLGKVLLAITAGALVLWLITKTMKSGGGGYKQHGTKIIKWVVGFLLLALVIFYLTPWMTGVLEDRSREDAVVYMPVPMWPADTTTVLSGIDTTWSEAWVVPEEARGGQITWTLLDSSGDTDCYMVRLSQGEFRMCPGQTFDRIEGNTSFLRFRMLCPHSHPHEIALRVRKPV